MDFKQQNGGSAGQTQYPRNNSRLRHQSSTASSVSPSSAAAAPQQQKVTMRRRCRSESLPIAPMMYETKSSKARLQGHHNHPNQQKVKSGEVPTLLIESFSLQGNGRKLLPTAGGNDLLPSIAVNSAKENVIQNGGHARLDGGSINAKDLYLSDLDGYRKDRRNGYYIARDRKSVV